MSRPWKQYWDATLAKFEHLDLDYKPLSIAKQEIRLIVLKPTEDDAEVLRCSLKHFAHAQAPEYVALSYCWGDSTKKLAIWIDGRCIYVNENLGEALYVLRGQGFRRLWVDAICINQQDDEEKSSQVLRMSAIYRTAEEVAVWLGNSDRASRDIFKLANHIAASPGTFDFVSDDFMVFKPGYGPGSGIQLKILSLIDWQYWSRVWILQEVAVGARVRVFCGQDSTDWENLVRVVDTFRDNRHLFFLTSLWPDKDYLPRFHCYNNLVDLRHKLSNDKLPTMLASIRSSRCSQATHSRDFIYALIGITIDGPRLVPAPSYEVSIDEVLRRLTIQFIKAKQTLDIILLKTLDSQDDMKRPSWIPNWLDRDSNGDQKRILSYLLRDSCLRHGLPRTHWNATCGSPAVARVDERREGKLHVKGYRVATITGMDLSRWFPGQHIKEQKIKATIDSPRQNPYKSPEGTARAILAILTIITDQNAAEIHCQRFADLWGVSTSTWLWDHWPRVHEWLFLNKDFEFHGKTLVEWATVLDQLHSESSIINNQILLLQDLSQQRPSNNCQQFIKGTIARVLQENLKLMTTLEGHIGWASPLAEPGDKIYLLAGCTMPVILQSCHEANTFRVVGDSYVAGMMDGEYWDPERIEDIKLV